MIFAVLASNWDLSLGYAGIYNFAHGAFFALGAYAAAISSIRGVSPWIGILLGGAVAVFASIIVCFPVLRVRGIYVCLVTFAFSQLCLHVVRSQVKYTGGAIGLTDIPSLTIGSYALVQNGKLGYYYLALALMVMSTLYLTRLVSSDFGLSIVALRDFEDYAISRGIPRARQRFLTFIASSLFTGFAGSIFALYSGVVVIELFSFGYLTTLLSMVILGGVSTIFGPMIGAFVLSLLSEFLETLGSWQYLIIAVATVIVLIYYPGGIYNAVKKGLGRFFVMSKG
jgi:branched-chain amino acid transport system permease protein